jgi:hypothetical protein
MNRKEFELLQESYEDMNIKNYINGLYEEGYSEDEITNLLTEAGILSRGLAHLKGLFNKNTAKNAGQYVTGKLAGSSLGQKASEFAQKGAGALQKGLVKGGKALGISDRAMKNSGAYKGLGQAAKNVDTAIGSAVQKGYDAESNVRSQKLASLVDSHVKDVTELFNGIVQQKTEVLTNIRSLIDQIMDDYQKIGGLKDTRVASTLKPTIEQNIVQKFLSRPLSALTDPKQLAADFRKDIIGYINKEKGSGKEGLGLRSADKLK